MWTEQQKKAIETRERNILVSAAAGSGKTAVLTQRILQKIMTGETSADRLVVVTFTKAAAAEMRERIRKGLEEEFKKNPSDKGLFVQMTLLGDADICTIDSFCNKIVKTHFEEAGTDPAYRIAEDGELSLIKADVFSKVIEEFYNEGGEDFFDFASAFSSAKNDSDIEKMIYDVYDEADNKPWPDEWLGECLKNAGAGCRAAVTDGYSANSDETTADSGDPAAISCNGVAGKTLRNSTAIAGHENRNSNSLLYGYLERIKKKLREYAEAARAAVSRIYEGSGLEKYRDFIENEAAALDGLCDNEELYGFYRNARTFEFGTLPSAKKGSDEELKALCKGVRDAYKKYLLSIVPQIKDGSPEGEDDFYVGGRVSEADAEYIKKQTELVIRITRRFSEVLEDEKKKRNIVTFADIEHMALNILVNRKGGYSELTQAATDLKSFYDEILTDEYQDSNALQEEILSAVAKDNNRYMVGDVKQSIYAFRGGDPGLFLDKYDKFGGEPGKADSLIILQNNFRSREGVLEGCNLIFSSVMNREYTGISYDDSEKLVPSFEFGKYEGTEPTFAGDKGRVDCEVILCDKDELREPAALEGVRIANIIRGYMDERRKVYDTKKKIYRDITYRDFVVLTRNRTFGAALAEVLNAADIPAYAESTSSYMDTYEIRPVISLLKVIDNPLDDVEFTAVMLSYFGGFTADEAALLRAGCKDEFFYRGMAEMSGYRGEEGRFLASLGMTESSSVMPEDRSVMVDNPSGGQGCCRGKKVSDEKAISEELKNKAAEFIKKIDGLREESASLSVYDLLWRVIYETGYYSYLGSMLGAKRRLANADLLLNRAFMFTGTSFNGLFQFLRYVERLEETDKARGEISAVSEVQDVVRVMTIHKSKGLEFPVVFLAGMEKQLNLTDSTDREKMIIGEDTIVTDVYDNTRKVKRITAFKKALQAQKKQSAIAEELRLLYVAMTRAVEKLYIIGTYKGDSIQKAGGDAFCYKTTGRYGTNDLDSCINYFRMFLPVVLRAQEEGSGLFDVTETDSADIPDPENVIFIKDAGVGQEDPVRSREADKFASFEYPYGDETEAKPKVTVTELKRMSYADEAETALDYRQEYGTGTENEEEYASFSDFAETMGTGAAGRGTIYHKFLEHMDFFKCHNEDEVEKQVKALIDAGKLPQGAEDVIKAEEIVKLAASDIGKRLEKAFAAGKVKREQQFMMGIPFENRSEDLLVQGVIDLCFEEEDGLVVLDYKTDKVSKKGGADVLKKRYGKQLELYAEAAGQAFGKPVKESVIYSFALNKTIGII